MTEKKNLPKEEDNWCWLCDYSSSHLKNLHDKGQYISFFVGQNLWLWTQECHQHILYSSIIWSYLTSFIRQKPQLKRITRALIWLCWGAYRNSWSRLFFEVTEIRLSCPHYPKNQSVVFKIFSCQQLCAQTDHYQGMRSFIFTFWGAYISGALWYLSTLNQ